MMRNRETALREAVPDCPMWSGQRVLVLVEIDVVAATA